MPRVLLFTQLVDPPCLECIVPAHLSVGNKRGLRRVVGRSFAAALAAIALADSALVELHEPHNEGVAHSEQLITNYEDKRLSNYERSLREIISPWDIPNSDMMSTVWASEWAPFTQTVLMLSL